MAWSNFTFGNEQRTTTPARRTLRYIALTYDSYHNITNPGGAEHIYTVVDNICETDTFAWVKVLHEAREGNLLCFHNARNMATRCPRLQCAATAFGSDDEGERAKADSQA